MRIPAIHLSFTVCPSKRQLCLDTTMLLASAQLPDLGLQMRQPAGFRTALTANQTHRVALCSYTPRRGGQKQEAALRQPWGEAPSGQVGSAVLMTFGSADPVRGDVCALHSSPLSGMGASTKEERIFCGKRVTLVALQLSAVTIADSGRP